MTDQDKETILDADVLDNTDNLDTEPAEDNSENEPENEETDEQATSEKKEEPVEKPEIPEKYKKFVANPEQPTEQELAIIKQFQEQDQFITKVTQEKTELQKKQEAEKLEYDKNLIQAQATKLDTDYKEAMDYLYNEKSQILKPYKEALINGEISQAEYDVYERQADGLYEQKKTVLNDTYVQKAKESQDKRLTLQSDLVNKSYQKFETEYTEPLKLDENKFLYDSYKSKFGVNANPEELPMILEWAEGYYKARIARETKGKQLNASKEQHKKVASNPSTGSKSSGSYSKHTVDDLLSDDKVFNKYF